MTDPEPLTALILALPETAGSALYGMVDVLAATGTLWQELTGDAPGHRLIQPRIVSTGKQPFVCGNGIPVSPETTIADDLDADIVILPELWLAPDDAIDGRHEEVKEWVRRRYRQGASIYSACSGAVLLAASGLLDGCEATSHWGYIDLFQRKFPKVRFKPEPSLVISDPAGRIVTAGGTTSWHDLAIHIVARHCSPGEALRISKIYLLKWHSEGQLPFASLLRRQPHADAAVRRVETFLEEHYLQPQVVSAAVEASGLPERTLKRRFKAATGSSLLDYVQNLRIECAKRLLEDDDLPVDEIAAHAGYENAAFFRRLFKRSTGLKPGDYRRMFQPIAGNAAHAASSFASSP
jgi:transcriptional regulator GlxA family with amidase domain